jgi:hypothetical protein
MFNKTTCLIVTILCLQTVYSCLISVIGQYIYKYYLARYPNSSHNGTNMSYTFHSLNLHSFQRLQHESCTMNTSDKTDQSAQIWAEEQSADLLSRMALWRAIPVIIITYVFGVYASQLNQSIVLLMSIVGNTMHVVIYQGIIYQYLDEHWWCISAFIAGLAGGTNIISSYRYICELVDEFVSYGICLCSMYSGIVLNLIITETTDEHKRSTYFVRLSAINTGQSALVTFASGYYIQWRGFTDLFWMAIGIEILSMLIVICFYQSTNSRASIDETTSLLSTNDIHVERQTSNVNDASQCFQLCTLFNLRTYTRDKSISLILTLNAYGFHLLALSAMSTLLWTLLDAPFCWTSEDLGNYSATSLISTAILSVVGMQFLTRCGADDALISAFGHVCSFSYALCIALVQYNWQLYLALLINPFSTYQSILIIPMVSKLLAVHDRSHVFTLITEINTIILAFGSSLFNWIYARTVTYEKNFTFLLACSLSCVSFVLCL